MRFHKISLAALLIASGMGAVAAEHHINVQGRFDYVSADNDQKKTGTPNYTNFEAATLYTSFSGTVNEKLDYYARFNWKKTGTDSTDNLNKIAEYIYITHKPTSNIDINIGKQFVWYGTREEDYNAADVYHYSLAGNGTTGLRLPFYELGVNVATKFSGQSLMWQVFNADKPLDGTNKKQRNLLYGVTYLGDLMNGKILPMASYHVLPSSDANDAKETYLAAGSRFNFGMMYFDLDYNLFKGDKSNSGKDVEVTSIVSKIGYKMDKHHVALKFVMDKLENDNTETFSENAYALSYEYQVMKELRYHVAYVMQDRDYKAAGTQDPTFTKIILGMKFNVDVL